MERERDIEKWLRQKIEQMGGIAMKFTSPGNDGVPDRIAILPGGQVWFIELKASGEEPRKIQEWQIKRLRNLGCNVAVITGMNEAHNWLWEVII